MKFLFVTYRWGAELVGGAEIHHRRLARELADLGHDVAVYTTDGRIVRNFCHWGVIWERAAAPPPDSDDGFVVHRFPLKTRPTWLLAAGAKALQARIEHEESHMDAGFLESLVPDSAAGGVRLLTGWHYPDVGAGSVTRWTHGRALMHVKGDDLSGCRLVVGAHAPKANVLSIRRGGHVLAEARVQPGNVEISADLKGDASGGIYELHCGRVWHPLRDFRGIGVLVHGVRVVNVDGATIHAADMMEDHRSLGRQQADRWQAFLLGRAQARPAWAGALVDMLRGPESPGLRRMLSRVTPDVRVIHCNLPWANASLVRPGDLVMPLWHVEDEFYYWSHWIEAIRRAGLVLANTPYTADDFFARLGVPAVFVGPPIWPAGQSVDPAAVEEFRKARRIDDGEVLVLTVCRKSGEKRYEAVAESVARLRAAGLPVRMWGVGPDADGRPFSHDGGEWLGQLSGEELHLAYAACDVFCLMSESESFGMVIPEAWHHGRPVVVNAACRPAASLVAAGEDGLLARPGAELDEALRQLAGSPELRERLGNAGRDKARRDHTRGAAARRLLAALE